MLRTILAPSGWGTRHRTLLAGLVLAVLVVLAAGSASATPLYFTGSFGIGSTAAEAAAAQAADASLVLLDLDSPIPGLGVAEFAFAAEASVALPNCSDEPANPSCIALRVGIPPLTFPAAELPLDPSLTPIEATSTWTVTNSTGEDLLGAFLVFSWTAGADSGDPSLVGLEPVTSDDYVLVTKNFGALGAAYLVAIDLGPLAASGPGATATAMIHYRVADDLIPGGGGGYLLPELQTEALVVPVPEPGAFSLFAIGLMTALAAIRRSRCD